ncbi:HEPN domain-containing protein [Saccharospirillum salsuginis]|uniref:Nucleotidyltransferase n=1 Tax=Saccharospirillum salsuginis TaxID=418750 RepID=A0A918NF31_9GAMM|nr:HEPN domain-containing protein [Saccharospirillum salsuginis]GGX62500.1 nucleotidyltransferase [Saccharospirillum salsuginis]
MKTSLDHLPDAKQEDIQTIATVLRDALDEFLAGKTGRRSHYRILKIILFGSYAKGTWVSDPANGYESDYDILVIVNKPALVEEYEVWQAAEDRIIRRVSAPLGLIVHTLAEVNEWLDQGHYFFRDIRQEGIELYSADGRELALPGKLTPEERKAIAQKHFDQWFESAEQFFVSFQDDLNRGWYKKAAFMLHQATERFLSCVLLVCTNYLPKTHNLEHLRSLCAQQDVRFSSLFPADSKFHRRSFQRLKRAYVDARYSEHFEITEEELEWLTKVVMDLKKLSYEICTLVLNQQVPTD